MSAFLLFNFVDVKYIFALYRATPQKMYNSRAKTSQNWRFLIQNFGSFFFVDLFKAYCLQAAGHLNALKLVGFINIVD